MMRRLPAVVALLFAAAWPAAHGTPAGRATAKPLRVCADPDNLPFSNRAGQGFENRLAEMIAGELGTRVQYAWSGDHRHFLKVTLDAGRCDVVMGIPAQSDRVLTTRPYYRSTYALVYRANAGYDLRSLDDPRLRKLTVGVRAIGDDYNDLPAGSVLAHRGIVRNVVTYNIFSKQGRMNPPARLIDAVADGAIDVAIAWGPLAGYFARRQPVALAVVPLTPTHTILPLEFSISLGVRKNDGALRAKLDAVLERRRADIHALLARYGVPLLDFARVREASDVAIK